MTLQIQLELAMHCNMFSNFLKSRKYKTDVVAMMVQKLFDRQVFLRVGGIFYLFWLEGHFMTLGELPRATSVALPLDMCPASDCNLETRSPNPNP